jgi:NDP-sugar pyrophosphorylase family protein
VAAFVSDASFSDIGTPRDYLDTSLALARLEGDHMAGGLRALVSPSAEIIGSALWDDVSVGDGARLVDCIACDGVTIPSGASYERSAIVRGEGLVPAADERLEGDLLIRPI